MKIFLRPKNKYSNQTLNEKLNLTSSSPISKQYNLNNLPPLNNNNNNNNNNQGCRTLPSSPVDFEN